MGLLKITLQMRTEEGVRVEWEVGKKK